LVIDWRSGLGNFMLRYLVTSSVLLLSACSAFQPAESVTHLAVVLHNDAPERQDLGLLSYRGGLHLSHPDPAFGGWSALDISDDGANMVAVSDSAYWMTAGLSWTEGGWLDAVSDIEIAPLLGTEGQELTGSEEDSESIAKLADGRYAVAFERHHRMNVYDLGTNFEHMQSAQGQSLPMPPGMEDLPSNGGLEGLVALDDGAILAAVEFPPSEDEARLLWHFDGTDWVPVRVQATPDFAMTSLDVHGGYIYALERFWEAEIGTRIRIIRFATSALTSGDIIEPELLAALEASNPVDNFEGISILDRDGETLVLIISDDNYNQYGDQRTLLLAFAVDE
jgi:hypothetical protein